VNTTNQRAAAWGGIVSMAILLLGMWVIAGFVPPPGPELSVDEIVAIYVEHNTAIKAGIIIAGAGCTLLVPWSIAIAVQMRRIEGEHAVLAGSQAVLGPMLLVEFYIPCIMWEAAAYRPTLDPVFTYRLHDLASIMFIALPWTGMLQAIVLGLAILQDRSADPVFPRWLGYFCFFSSLAFLPGGLNCLAKTGPLAWDGLFAWWLGLAVFGTWIAVVAVALVRYAIPHQERHARAHGGLSTPSSTPA
jgi:hypothetical protein